MGVSSEHRNSLSRGEKFEEMWRAMERRVADIMEDKELMERWDGTAALEIMLDEMWDYEYDYGIPHSEWAIENHGLRRRS